MSAKTIDFWFDPLCPWCWITSRWIEQVTKVRTVEVRWHVMSLAILNENKEDSDSYREKLQKMLAPVRVGIAIQQLHGDEHVKPFYDIIGKKIHTQKHEDWFLVLEETIAELNFPKNLIDYATSNVYDTQLRASHNAGMGTVGSDVGTPIIAIDGVGFFGPVITPAPKGEAAGKLWDALSTMATIDGFYELKRGRDKGPIFD